MESPDPGVLRSPVSSCHACPVYLGPNLKRSLPHKTVAPTSSFFLLRWLRYHSNRPGRSCLRNVYVPGALIPLWHHNQVCPDWSDHVSTASTAPLPPVSSHLCGSFLARTSDLGIACLLHVPSSDHSRFNWHDTSVLFQSTPIWTPHCGGQEGFHLVSTQTPQALSR
jgi:hypothetical protein